MLVPPLVILQILDDNEGRWPQSYPTPGPLPASPLPSREALYRQAQEAAQQLHANAAVDVKSSGDGKEGGHSGSDSSGSGSGAVRAAAAPRYIHKEVVIFNVPGGHTSLGD